MIDPLYRQQLRDQVDVVRELLSEMLTQAALIDLLTDLGDKERVIEAGLRVSEAALQIDELTAELCDTAARFDLVALRQLDPVSLCQEQLDAVDRALAKGEVPPGFTEDTWEAACREAERLTEAQDVLPF